MTSEPFASFTPPSMRFEPVAAEVTGPAFSKSFKALACILVIGCALWLWRLHVQGLVVLVSTSGSWFFLGGGFGLMFYTLAHILASRSKLTANGIEQTWIWNKKIDIQELAYAKLIRFKGLEWLIAPRFYTRNFSGKPAVIYVSSPLLWTELERLATELTKLRQPN